MRLPPLTLAVLTAFVAAGCSSDGDTPAATAGAATPGAAAAPNFTVKVIGFNDFHGNLQAPSGTFGVNTAVPTDKRPVAGGADYLAAYVNKMKAANPLNVVVGAGDFIGASPLISALFHDEPTVEALNKIGLEFNAVGNHEFDKGAQELLRLQSGGCHVTDGKVDGDSCRGLGSAKAGTFDGAKFQWLSANVTVSATGMTLLPAYGVKEFNGVKVAFIGMTLKGTPGIVAPSGVAGLEFKDEAATVNALVPELRKQGIESIVVLVHQGGFQSSPNLGDINGCVGNLKHSDGSDSDIAKIVKQLNNAVDLVISGHTHAAYNCSANTVDVTGTAANGATAGNAVLTPRPTGLPNASGRLVPVTSANAFGRVLTDIDLTLNPNTRDVVAVSPKNVLVDRGNTAVAADAVVKKLVDDYAEAVAPISSQVVGTIAQAVPNTAGASGEIPAGDLIADAQLAATQPAALGGAVIAFMNPGGVRASGFITPAGASYPYNVTYSDAFTVQPFGNILNTLDLTAKQLKDLLEQQFVGCLGQTTQRILQISNGLKFTWKAGNAPCSKIVDLRFTPMDLTVNPPAAKGPEEVVVANGVVQNPARVYRVTTNNFLQTGGDGFTVLTGGTNVRGGGQDIDALVAYFSAFKPPKGAYDLTQPLLNLPRITRVD